MIQVIHRAFDILELVSEEPGKSKTLTEIADHLHLNHGTCANILKTLVSRSYIEKLPGKKGYQLGHMATELSGKKNFRERLVSSAREEMEKLTKKFNENTLLSILKGNQRVAILRVNSHHQLQAVTPTEKDAFNSSTGRLLVAMLPDPELERFIRQYGLPESKKGKALTMPLFLEDVRTIRKEKVVMHLPDDEIFGMAVPIYRNERVVASLSIYLPAYRCTAALKKEMRMEITAAAEKISCSL